MNVVIDTETTGLYPAVDEILQVSIIDTEGNVLFDDYFKPTHTTSWEDAEKVNGISPDMVESCPPLSDKIKEINDIINRADCIIGYNTNFDLAFLKSGGLKPSADNVKIVDVMEQFAPIYGEWSAENNSYKWKSLSKAADFFGYDWHSGPANAHNSLADCYATLYVMNKINEYNNSEKKQKLPSHLLDKFLLPKETTILVEDWRGFPITSTFLTSIKESFVQGKGWLDNQQFQDMVRGYDAQQLSEFNESVTMIHARCVDHSGCIHNIDMPTYEYDLLNAKTYDPLNKEEYSKCVEANEKTLKNISSVEREKVFVCADCVNDGEGHDTYILLKMDCNGLIEKVKGDLKENEVKSELLKLYKEFEVDYNIEINIPSKFKENFELIKDANQIIMHNCGYNNYEMFPILNNDTALKAFDNGMPVYLLYSDNTEGLAQSRDEIEKYEGVFGIEMSEFTLSSLNNLPDSSMIILPPDNGRK